MESLEDEFIEFGSSNPQGVTDEDIKRKFPGLALKDIALVINSLSKKNLLQILKQGDSLLYKISRNSSNSSILETLNPDEKIIFLNIKSSDNKGIWIKDLKIKSNLHQNVLTKILKNLESKKLIKSVKSIKNSTKKVYMLYDLEPSTDVTGGPWFSDNEFDSEFIEGLAKASHKFIGSKSFPINENSIFSSNYKGFASLQQVHSFIMDSGICNIELSLDDISSILDLLIYDGKVERVIPEPLFSNSNSNSYLIDEQEDNVFYKASKSGFISNIRLNVPCRDCPVFHSCSDFGPITPSKCEYFLKWLNF